MLKVYSVGYGSANSSLYGNWPGAAFWGISFQSILAQKWASVRYHGESTTYWTYKVEPSGEFHTVTLPTSVCWPAIRSVVKGSQAWHFSAFLMQIALTSKASAVELWMTGFVLSTILTYWKHLPSMLNSLGRVFAVLFLLVAVPTNSQSDPFLLI